jgi:predicted RNA-binding Zn-ribbon protein involved in translation (DUF1610 family)
MAYVKPYKCTKCGAVIPREQVTVVKVQFLPLGPGPKIIKSRTTAWLCPECLDEDPVWNLASHDAPAYQM